MTPERTRELLSEGLDLCVRARKMDAQDRATAAVERIAAGLRADGRGSWLTDAWDAFCDCDPLPNGIDYQSYLDWLDETPLIEWRSANADDLEQPFADELGIVPGGMVYDLLPLGLAVRAYLQEHPR